MTEDTDILPDDRMARLTILAFCAEFMIAVLIVPVMATLGNRVTNISAVLIILLFANVLIVQLKSLDKYQEHRNYVVNRREST